MMMMMLLMLFRTFRKYRYYYMFFLEVWNSEIFIFIILSKFRKNPMELESNNLITLRGSTDIVCEFFNFAVNSVIYNRGIYPPENFKRVSKYGISTMVGE